LAILDLQAARRWSIEKTARVFHVTAPTIASWLGRLDEEGPDALVQLRTPANRLRDFVRYIVRRLITLCPTMGKVKIAQTLARAGLDLAATTVGRMLKEDAAPKSRPEKQAPSTGRVVTATYSNHIWHIDLTAVPVGRGFWWSRLPFALPPCHQNPVR
jgi:hypothetical protein